MDIKRMADEAITVQDACNSSGVLYALARHVEELAQTNNNEQLKNHPVIIMFADKLDDLCRCREMPVVKTDLPVVELMRDFTVYMDAVCKEGIDTNSKNTHRDVQTCVLKLVHACDSRGMYRFSKAYDACQHMKETGIVETL
jgi:hypothetical protein